MLGGKKLLGQTISMIVDTASKNENLEKKKKNFKSRASAFLYFPFSSFVFSQNLQKLSHPWTTLFLPRLLYFFFSQILAFCFKLSWVPAFVSSSP